VARNPAGVERGGRTGAASPPSGEWIWRARPRQRVDSRRARPSLPPAADPIRRARLRRREDLRRARPRRRIRHTLTPSLTFSDLAGGGGAGGGGGHCGWPVGSRCPDHFFFCFTKFSSPRAHIDLSVHIHREGNSQLSAKRPSPVAMRREAFASPRGKGSSLRGTLLLAKAQNLVVMNLFCYHESKHFGYMFCQH
jgi:hypothetical protein